ncbi:uncharacterized protein LOC119690588 [Plutella xylostella]|uniref:uncharacterized protein LOC119690588 n=1 Tax=Plutella xylostella TaxID=51655 RepID=UPI0020326A94|nr:uncharacterized protein LOC119690588 [Plutella xylostella]
MWWRTKRLITDNETNAKKNKVWRKISDEFNLKNSSCVRNTGQLKTLWENIKRTTRKDKAKTKKEIRLTTGRGGTNPFQGQVEIILGTTLSGIENPLDSDANLVLKKVLANEVEVSENESYQSEISNTKTSVVDQCFIGAENESGQSQMYQDNITREYECMTNVSDGLVNNKEHSPTWLQKRRPKYTDLQYKILEHKLELAKLLQKNAESEGKMKYKIQEEQLKQEKINTKILELKLKAAQYELLNKNN